MQSRDRAELLRVVEEAFLAAHDGHSTDDVLICDRLNKRFLELCTRQLPDVAPVEFNRALLNLRKTSRLGSVAKRSIRVRCDDYLHAAEIAARHMQDKYAVSLDRVLCDPDHLAEFDRTAQGITPGVDGYVVRKAALRLRKTRKLRPELVPRLTGSWGRRVASFAADELSATPGIVPDAPGVYIFLDTSGYLYIGEAGNLRLRIRKHLDHSDSKSLARYFWENGYRGMQVEIHAFDPDSDGRLVRYRRAYESDLINSRSPRFNVRP